MKGHSTAPSTNASSSTVSMAKVNFYLSSPHSPTPAGIPPNSLASKNPRRRQKFLWLSDISILAHNRADACRIGHLHRTLQHARQTLRHAGAALKTILQQIPSEEILEVSIGDLQY